MSMICVTYQAVFQLHAENRHFDARNYLLFEIKQVDEHAPSNLVHRTFWNGRRMKLQCHLTLGMTYMVAIFLFLIREMISAAARG